MTWTEQKTFVTFSALCWVFKRSFYSQTKSSKSNFDWRSERNFSKRSITQDLWGIPTSSGRRLIEHPVIRRGYLWVEKSYMRINCRWIISQKTISDSKKTSRICSINFSDWWYSQNYGYESEELFQIKYRKCQRWMGSLFLFWS